MTEAARPVVALLESRMSRECARLVVKHGGEPLLAPALKEECATSPELVRNIVADIEAGRYEVVVFMTGVAVSQLFEAAELAGARAALVSGLRSITTVTRGPKPTAALRGFGVPPTLSARDAFTSSEVIDALAGIELSGCRVLLFHYGERSAALAETLLARGVNLTEIWLYRWLLPDSTAALESLVEELIIGRVDALAITCQIQFRHLMQVAERMGRSESLLQALNERVVMAVVGPTCNAIVQSYGVTVHVIPEHPKMGPLVATLMRYLQLRGRRSDGHESASVRVATVQRLPQPSSQN